MTLARWLVGGIAGVIGVLWIALAILGDSFRRSFGASPTAAWKFVVPLAVMVVLIVSAMIPSNRTFLHVTLVVVVALVLLLLWIARETPLTTAMGLAYCALWVWYYWMATRQGVGSSAGQ
jgi:hypothetical protein